MALDTSEVLTLQRLSLDQLAEMLAEQSDGMQFGSSQPTPEEKKQLGYALFTDVLNAVRPHLCTGGRLAQKIASAEETAIAAAVGDVVIVACSGLPVLVATAMILKYGITKLCDATC